MHPLAEHRVRLVSVEAHAVREREVGLDDHAIAAAAVVARRARPIDAAGLDRKGVHVLDVGLNGILITEAETRRTIVIYAEPWVKPTAHPFALFARHEGKNTEHAARSVLLKVVKGK